jgi:hypothetical protein
MTKWRQLPCPTELFQDTDTCGIIIYTHDFNIGPLKVNPEADHRTIKVSLEVDTEDYLKVCKFFDEIDPGSLKIERSNDKIRIEATKDEPEMWPQAEARPRGRPGRWRKEPPSNDRENDEWFRASERGLWPAFDNGDSEPDFPGFIPVCPASSMKFESMVGEYDVYNWRMDDPPRRQGIR